MNASEFGCGAAHQLAITASKAGWELRDFTILAQSEEKCGQVLLLIRGEAKLVFPKLIAKNILQSGEDFLNGKEFIRRARELPGAMNGNQKALEYYSKKENWDKLPNDASVNTIVFVNTVFCDSFDCNCVRLLCRVDHNVWYRTFRLISSRFSFNYRVAVLESPMNQGSVVL